MAAEEESGPPEKKAKLEEHANGKHQACENDGVRLSAAKTAQLGQRVAMAALRQAGTFCDVLLVSSEGKELPAHIVVLAAAAGDRLRGRLLMPLAVAANDAESANGHSETTESTDCGSEKLRRRLEAEVSSAALSAALDFIYTGEVVAPAAVVPELLRLARRWELKALQEAVLATLRSGLSSELVAGLLAIGEPLGGQLGAALYAHAVGHFPECVQQEAFGGWSAEVLQLVLRSDDLACESEEEVLSSIARWHRHPSSSSSSSSGSTPARKRKALTPVLKTVRWPLCSSATLDALADMLTVPPEDPSVSMRAAAAGQAMDARKAHEGADAGSDLPKLRKAFGSWWPGLGCSIRGGTILAGKGGEGKAGEAVLSPRVVRPHEGTYLFLSSAARQPGSIVQWFVRAKSGRPVVGPGSDLTGAGGSTFDDLVDVWSGPDDAYYVLDRDAEQVFRIRSGEATAVGANALKLHGPCAVSVAPDKSVYVLESFGSRVMRYGKDGRVRVAAGGPEPGDGPSQLNAGLTGRIFVAADGQLYVSDTGNHRVQRWDVGAQEGVTVAGGNGCGSNTDQLNHPGGVWVSSNGTLFVADTGNHRVVKWREGSKAAQVVAGGCGAGDGLHQFREPMDVAIDKEGALLVADFGNGRVVRWPAAAANSELLSLLRG
eukprot:TRINITY_DN27072_c0_g1_i1.p1 TRINITY_DN27072_c0_g1~~TRINITY_DN27072_c0_g1_i1.p1  ORF type:complete len:660 (+),score=194.94 TRINITY_DN27072_c0_g1_i1:88-2067(+)